MINIKECRQGFLFILKKICSNLSRKNLIELQTKINSLRKYIQEEYDYDKELPIVSHRTVKKLVQDLEEIDNLLGNIFVSEFYEMPEEAEREKFLLIQKANNLIKEYSINKQSFFRDKPVNISSILEKYYKTFGKKCVDEALKTGIEIFHKEKKHILLQKSDLMEKDFLKNIDLISRAYPLPIIEKYLIKGLINNLLFETKNMEKFNTKKLVDLVYEIKKRG